MGRAPGACCRFCLDNHDPAAALWHPRRSWRYRVWACPEPDHLRAATCATDAIVSRAYSAIGSLTLRNSSRAAWRSLVAAAREIRLTLPASIGDRKGSMW